MLLPLELLEVLLESLLFSWKAQGFLLDGRFRLLREKLVDDVGQHRKLILVFVVAVRELWLSRGTRISCDWKDYEADKLTTSPPPMPSLDQEALLPLIARCNSSTSTSRRPPNDIPLADDAIPELKEDGADIAAGAR